MKNPDNESILSSLIVGRVEPHIYAFTTNMISNYLKIGDTYRPVSVRLSEWAKLFPDLHKEFEESAVINDSVFFRDYSVHQFLEKDLSKHRLEPLEKPDVYYSNEFFKDVLIENVSAAVSDIKTNYEHNTGKYKYYDANSQLPETYKYASTGEWIPRPNQQQTIDNFVKAVNAGRTNLLMYAVMRFGKSFTALCCAKEISARIVLVVSAKADVREEWKKTVQSADNFNKDYVFIDSNDLMIDEKVITNTIASGKNAVVFLTLQDLQGDTIKDKHQEVFGQKIDLLIVDETHFGARAESYGRVLRTVNYVHDVKDEYEGEDFVEIADAEEQLKALSVRVTLHLSGTPYRILMGSEFGKDDIIAFYQFTDIVRDQEQWDKDNLFDDTNDIKEWDNPYFGFPQMIRFAFVPSKSALALLEKIKSDGTTYAFSAMFKPKSLSKDAQESKHKEFKYKDEVLELLQVIDGIKEDDGVLSFLDYDKIKKGKMCQHIVCVLPYRASCDALEALINDNRTDFKNLKDYIIINISGVDSPNTYRDSQSVKNRIKQCALEGKKTLTLTVNRMLTGSTVEEWDTMIFLKDTASPQEYDQAIFRLQNQYIKKYVNKDGDEIKYNMKPQTLLVDFDPHRMFVMQEQKSQIYNANTDASGNEHLRERLTEELRISPIISLNKNRIVQVEASDILAELSEYSSNRGVIDEVSDIPVDFTLLELESIKSEIENQAELGSRNGLSIEAHNGEQGDYSEPGNSSDETEGAEGNSDCGGNPTNDARDGSDNNEEGIGADSLDIKSLENKFRTFYSRILFFAYLTDSSVNSLDDIIQCFDEPENARIAKNLQLRVNILSLMKEHINIFILRQLDYKIQNINTLAHDENVEPMQRVAVAIRKFGRISDSEITTPDSVASAMVELIPDICFESLASSSDIRLVDIAGKMGEFAVAVVKRCNNLGIRLSDIKSKILTVPTSSIAYEFTRKVYNIIGLDLESIAGKFNSYKLLDLTNESDDDSLDLIKISNILSQNRFFSQISLSDEVNDLEENNRVIFGAIVGNPPYNKADGGAGASAEPLYHHFVDISKSLDPSYVSLIIPTRWFTGGKHLDDFRETMLDDIHIKQLHDCLHPEEIFPNTNNRGGICYFLWDKEYDNSTALTRVVTHTGNGNTTEVLRPMRTRDLDIFIRNYNAISIIDKVMPLATTESMAQHISARQPFGVESNIMLTNQWHVENVGLTDPICCYGKRMQMGFIERSLITKGLDLINKWKVYTPRANNLGTELSDDNLNTFLGEPGTVCTEAYIVIGNNLNLSETEARNLMTYFSTKFVRFMHSLAKASHDAPRNTYRFVPVVDFSESWTDNKLYRRFELTSDEIDLIENSIMPM